MMRELLNDVHTAADKPGGTSVVNYFFFAKECFFLKLCQHIVFFINF